MITYKLGKLLCNGNFGFVMLGVRCSGIRVLGYKGVNLLIL